MTTSQAHNLEPDDRILIDGEPAIVASCECGELIAITESGELMLFNSTTGFEEISLGRK